MVYVMQVGTKPETEFNIFITKIIFCNGYIQLSANYDFILKKSIPFLSFYDINEKCQ